MKGRSKCTLYMKVACSNLLHGEVSINRDKLSLVRKINLSHTCSDYWMMETRDGTRCGIARGNFAFHFSALCSNAIVFSRRILRIVRVNRRPLFVKIANWIQLLGLSSHSPCRSALEFQIRSRPRSVR